MLRYYFFILKNENNEKHHSKDGRFRDFWKNQNRTITHRNLQTNRKLMRSRNRLSNFRSSG